MNVVNDQLVTKSEVLTTESQGNTRRQDHASSRTCQTAPCILGKCLFYLQFYKSLIVLGLLRAIYLR